MARPSTMPKGIEQKMRVLVSQGVTDTEIAMLLKRSRSTVQWWRQKLGIRKMERGDHASRFSLTNYW